MKTEKLRPVLFLTARS